MGHPVWEKILMFYCLLDCENRRWMVFTWLITQIQGYLIISKKLIIGRGILYLFRYRAKRVFKVDEIQIGFNLYQQKLFLSLLA